MNNTNIPIERHPWEPFVPENSRVLILGAFPPKSNRWSMEFYYPNRINDFWRIIGLVFFADKDYFYDTTAKQFRLDDILKFLNSKGIAMGDAALEVKRLKDNASDKYLEVVTPLPLNDVIAKMPNCHTIVSTGEKAAQIIGQVTGTNVPAVGKSSTADLSNRTINIYRMPSTSRAYPLPIEQKADFYRDMFQTIGIL